jgi:hypothetical protein
MPSPSRLLFVGNSYTFRNDLPGLIARLAPHELWTQSIVAGGASLRRHINSSAVQKALDEAQWDIVILQEQSTLPLKNAARFQQGVRELHEAIARHGARTALYQTWARQNAPETQNALSAAYAEIADETGALLIPVGGAWHAALEMQSDLALFDDDGSHPTFLGSALAAYVFAPTLWPSDPRGLPLPDDWNITPAVADLLRDAAWEAIN